MHVQLWPMNFIKLIHIDILHVSNGVRKNVMSTPNFHVSPDVINFFYSVYTFSKMEILLFFMGESVMSCIELV